jgi:hypothetical protein
LASTTSDGLTTGVAEGLGAVGLDVVATDGMDDGEDATKAPTAANVSAEGSGVGCPCARGDGAVTMVMKMSSTLNATKAAAMPDATLADRTGGGACRGLPISLMPLGLLSRDGI